jgi:hypothetical protein
MKKSIKIKEVGIFLSNREHRGREVMRPRGKSDCKLREIR